MGKEDNMEVTGVIKECLPGTKFIVELENGFLCTCTISGKMRMANIRLLEGDKVTIVLSVYDVSNGRIVWRN